LLNGADFAYICSQDYGAVVARQIVIFFKPGHVRYRTAV